MRKGFTCPDLSPYMPDQRFTRVLDVLNIEEDCVRAHLVDSRGIEKIILIPLYNDAKAVVYDEKPRNVDSCYTEDAAQLISRAGSRMYFGIVGGGGKSRFFDDIGQQLTNAEHALETAKDQLRSIEDDRRNPQDAMRTTEKQLEGVKKTLGLAQNDLTRKKRDLVAAKESLEQEKPSNLGALEDEKVRIDEEYELMRGQYDILVKRVKEVEVRKDPVAKQLKAKESEHKEMDAQADVLRTESEKLVAQKGTLENHRSHYEKVRAEILSRIAEHEKVMGEARLKVHEVTTLAEKESPERVEVTKTLKALEAEIKKIERLLQQKENEFGDRGTTETEYNTKVEDYKLNRKGLLNCRDLLKRIDLGLKRRVATWYQFRALLAVRAKHFFSKSLNFRGFDGKLKLDHNKSTLKISVKTSEAEAASDTKQLSGGERSFSTVCFLLALWEATESPFRALDEYDVYMDAVNRRISTGMIIDTASASEHQFILISPQDMTNIKLGKNVNVVRLEPPERH